MVGFLSEHPCLYAGKTGHLRAVFSTAPPPPSREAPLVCLLLFSPPCFSTCTSLQYSSVLPDKASVFPGVRAQWLPSTVRNPGASLPALLEHLPAWPVCGQLGSFDPWVVLRGSGACPWLGASGHPASYVISLLSSTLAPLCSILFFTKQPEWKQKLM